MKIKRKFFSKGYKISLDEKEADILAALVSKGGQKAEDDAPTFADCKASMNYLLMLRNAAHQILMALSDA